ncbi:hypothetical protein [Flavobacterium sp.]|uniref:hypothetical protein n=1 Tax=Flavobacterium sp. TaxID=239 RepID=UPI00120B2853|nr:hypothetical protein [Flavobacterium sp.]RZJ72876.1 MAG: hypothetical protein EOO49_04380 [Flavobacterium sp.]
MKKLLLILAFAGLVSACGDDDSGEAKGPKPITVEWEQNGVTETRTFTYDDKDRISSVALDDQLIVFTYNEKNKVAKLTLDQDEFVFNYEGNTLVSLSSGQDQQIPITSLGDNAFTYAGVPFSRNSVGDWSTLSIASYTYKSGKGVFANVRHLDLFALYLVDNQSYLYASKKRISALSGEGQTYPFLASDGQSGLPATANIFDRTFTFTYLE